MKQSQKLNRKYLNLISLLGNLLDFFFHWRIKNSLFWRVLPSFYFRERKVKDSNAVAPVKNHDMVQMEWSFDLSG